MTLTLAAALVGSIMFYAFAAGVTYTLAPDRWNDMPTSENLSTRTMASAFWPVMLVALVCRLLGVVPWRLALRLISRLRSHRQSRQLARARVVGRD